MAFYTQKAFSMQSSGGYGQCGVGGMQGGSGQVGGGYSQAGASYGQGSGQMVGFAYDAAQQSVGGAVGGGFCGGAVGGGFGGGAVGGGYGGGAAGGGYGGGAVGGGYGGGAVGGGYGGGAVGGGYGGGGAVGGGYGGADAGAGFGGGGLLLGGNEKQTMQNLNDRLAKYLDQVKLFEASNVDLEKKIKEFLEKQKSGSTTGEGKDYSPYYKKIEELKANIITACNENNHILLEIDNTRLAADDFRLKYDNEHNLRITVEADIFGLRKILDEMTIAKSDLESQVESLIQELALVKKNHEEEVKGQQQTTVGDVNVEMNAVPSNNLLQKMNEMREQYEAMAAKNRKEAEEQFKKASEGLKKEIDVAVEEGKTTKSEVSELRKTLQSLEIELQSQLSMKKSLEETLAQTEGQYCAKIAQIQIRITALEEQVAQIRAEMECQNAEYQDLLEVKSKLEGEIKQYEKLLNDSSSTGQGSSQTPGKGTTQGTTSTTQGDYWAIGVA